LAIARPPDYAGAHRIELDKRQQARKQASLSIGAAR
jgi:hypothetical protein